MNRVDTFFIPSEKSYRIEISQLKNNKISLVVPLKQIQKSIQPEESFITIPNTQFLMLLSSQQLFGFPFYKENITQWELFRLTEDIRKRIDEQLKFKISENKYLRKVLVCSMAEIKKYLEKTNKRYELNAFVWFDYEDRTWEENIISVKIEYKDNKEKRKIWKQISSIVEKNDTEGIINLLTEVERL
jgi:hypothetical protein